MFEAASQAQGIKRRTFTDEELRDRLILPMINEAAKLIEEGIVIRPSDIDVVWQNGYGWPNWKRRTRLLDRPGRRANDLRAVVGARKSRRGLPAFGASGAARPRRRIIVCNESRLRTA